MVVGRCPDLSSVLGLGLGLGFSLRRGCESGSGRRTATAGGVESLLFFGVPGGSGVEGRRSNARDMLMRLPGSNSSSET
jgi:hypothetical protein